ncbi:nuclear transport factor 2 family protein [Sphingomicrobium nitratireducens]|uniref:nuclear transport factor 2 family protein n=1 Tax=Sphingomicrobium nitratireducens TaxID=2964666 RepID=UPI00223E951F|nr:nuclear transport factor 2 family protein [Sphingomicrobium nitratireducens]
MTNVQTVQAFWRAIAARDVDAYLDTFAADAVAHDPANGPALDSREARREFMENLLAGFDEIETTIDFVTPCGDRLTAAKWTVRGTSQEGQPIHLEGIDTYEHDRDGKLVAMKGYFEA